MSVYIIAEVGVNHNGSLERAKEMVMAAADAGVDAVKFQLFHTENLMTTDAPKAKYQQETTGKDGNQFDMTKALELTLDDLIELQKECKNCSVDFLATPFDEDSLQELVKACDVSTIKIPSGEITNAKLLLTAARTGREIILSTGMATLGEVEAALGVLAYGALRKEGIPQDPEIYTQAYAMDLGQDYLRSHVTLLHCTTEYPAPFESVNLRSIKTMRQAFGLPVGYSDHTQGTTVPIAAVALGAVIIEKHFTLDRNLPGPDHKASLEPAELKDMVRRIRETEAALGRAHKMPAEAEWRNVAIARKSLVAAKDIKQGEKFTEENLTAKRPGDGVSPMLYGCFLGQTARRDYKKDEAIGLD